jgi:transposase
MTISEFTLKSGDAEPVRRFEVFTGTGRRCDWPPEEKARIVAESYEAGETVCDVARRYALSPQQLFACRRASRKLPEPADLSPPLFVPAVLPAREEPSAKPIRRQPSQKAFD